MMTDDEIDRGVALMEGWRQVMVTPLEAAQRGLMPPIGSGMVEAWQCPNTGQLRGSPPFYSTHWSWCGPLVEKHNVVLSGTPGAREAYCLFELQGHWVPTDEVEADTPQRAICLAVIAAR